MAEALDHLWQSTLFAIAAGVLTIAFRRNGAHVRYWLWFSASVKFLIPFSLLIDLGSRMLPAHAAEWLPQKDIAVAIAQIGQPLSKTWISLTPDVAGWIGLIALGVWACGFGSIVWLRLRMWRGIRSAMRASRPFDVRFASIPPNVRVGSAPGLLEPGVVGWLRPVLLLPAGIEEHLTSKQLDAVLAHELCHVRRRDNLAAAIHMISEAVFWFHPLVWWIGARLMDERERACDEDVLRSGRNPRVYAESILKICAFCVESPLSCVAGATGSDLTKRIEAIMKNESGEPVRLWQKLLLGAAIALAAAIPVGVGVLDAPRLHAESGPLGSSSPALEGAPAGLQIDAANFCCPDYLVEMIDRIGVNWIRQSEVGGSNTVKFMIHRDGRIASPVIERASGFRDLDERSEHAVRATKAVNPLPEQFPNPTLTVHLNFDYQR